MLIFSWQSKRRSLFLLRSSVATFHLIFVFARLLRSRILFRCLLYKKRFSCRLTRRRGFRKRQLVRNSSGNLFEQTVRQHFMPRSWNAYLQHTATRTQNAEFCVLWMCSQWILELHGSFVTIDDHVWPALCSYRMSFTFSIEQFAE